MHKTFTLLCRLAFCILLSIPAGALASEAIPAVPTPAALPVAPAPAPATASTPAAVAAPGPAEAAKPPLIRIGYVEMSRFGAETGVGKAARSRMQEKAEALKKQIAARQKQLEKQKNQLEAKLPTLSPKERAAKAKEFEKKYEEYRKFVEKAEKELQGVEEELTRKLYGEIESAAAAYGKANGLAAIVVKRDLLYAGSGVEAENVTEGVMKLLNARETKE
jgi:outer membrane protein